MLQLNRAKILCIISGLRRQKIHFWCRVNVQKKGRNSTIHEAQAEKKKTRENSCAVFPENFQVHK
jgi:hypothetical protein